AAAGAVAVGGVAGVTVVDDHLLEVGANVVGGNLGKGRLLALTVRRNPREDRHLAARLDPDRRALPGAEAADLDVGGETDTEVAALFTQLRLLLAELLVIDQLKRLVERFLVLAGVVVLTGERGVRELVRLDEVDTADVGRVEPAPVGDHVGE